MASENTPIRFVNRTGVVQHFPTPRGARMALAPDEWTSDPYYSRFSRLANEQNPGGRKPLTMEYPDGTPYGVDKLPEGTSIQAPPVLSRSKAKRTPAAPITSGCTTSCEAACQFPAESSSSHLTVDDINNSMDKQSAQPLPDDSLKSAEEPLEAVIDPSMVAEASESANTYDDELPPPPQVNGSVTTGVISVEELMKHFNLDDQHILEVNEKYLKILLNGRETYVSRLQLGWTTEHLTAMKTHVTRLEATLI